MQDLILRLNDDDDDEGVFSPAAASSMISLRPPGSSVLTVSMWRDDLSSLQDRGHLRFHLFVKTPRSQGSRPGDAPARFTHPNQQSQTLLSLTQVSLTHLSQTHLPYLLSTERRCFRQNRPAFSLQHRGQVRLGAGSGLHAQFRLKGALLSGGREKGGVSISSSTARF